MREAVAKAYDRAGPAYSAWRWSSLWDKVEIDFVAQRLPFNGRLLDAGCGYGRYANRVRQMSLDYVGVDCSAHQIKLARMAHSGTRFDVGDIANLKFSNASFDTIVCTRVLSHGVDLGSVLNEFARLLRAGGHLIITDISSAHHYDKMSISIPGGDVHVPIMRYSYHDLINAVSSTSLRLQGSFRIGDLGMGRGPLLDVTYVRKVA